MLNKNEIQLQYLNINVCQYRKQMVRPLIINMQQVYTVFVLYTPQKYIKIAISPVSGLDGT